MLQFLLELEISMFLILKLSHASCLNSSDISCNAYTPHVPSRVYFLSEQGDKHASENSGQPDLIAKVSQSNVVQAKGNQKFEVSARNLFKQQLWLQLRARGQ